MELIMQWLPYYIFGLVGILIHIIFKLNKGESFKVWLKENQRDLWLSILSYHVILFLWVDTSTFEFFGMAKNTPTGMTLFAGYAGNSIIINLLEKYDKKIADWKEKNGQ